MIQALGNNIIVQEMKREKSKGGLIIPDSVQEPQKYGVVLSVGDQAVITVKEGDVITFPSTHIMALLLEGKLLCCVPETVVFGIITSDELIESLIPLEVKQVDLDGLDKALKETQPASGSRIVRV